MAIRIHCDDELTAEEYAEMLRTAGYAAEVVAERFAGEDDDTELDQVVTTDAPVEAVNELIEEGDAFIEVSDPMSGTSARVPTDQPEG